MKRRLFGEYRMRHVSASIGDKLGALTVTIAVALNVALRTRQVSETPWRLKVGAVQRPLMEYPRDFFLPPKKQEE